MLHILSVLVLSVWEEGWEILNPWALYMEDKGSSLFPLDYQRILRIKYSLIPIIITVFVLIISYKTQTNKIHVIKVCNLFITMNANQKNNLVISVMAFTNH